jgi:carboxypeptidase Taq
MSSRPAYDALCAHHARVYRLEHVQAIASWDRMTFMPPGGAEARGDAQAELSAIILRLQNDPAVPALLERARQEALGEWETANLAAMERQLRAARAIPEALAERRERLCVQSTQAWAAARSANDWATFSAALAPLLDVVREEADRLGQAFSLSRYDALLDRHEPGLRDARVAELFGDVAEWLPALIDKAVAAQADWPDAPALGPFPADRQKRVCERVMTLLGFDFGAGRLDVSLHPFTGGVPEDVRLTTRYTEADIVPALLATAHETGHARYQQNLPRAWLGQPIAGPASAGLHEAQALTFERQLARERPFLNALSRLLEEEFGPGLDVELLYRLTHRVRRDKNRVAADELTYPAHVILRTEIERALIGGEIGVDDIPALWDARMQALLGVDTKGDFSGGPLQDIHWSQGLFGYFPAYLIGAMTAAQLFATFKAQTPSFGAQAESGDFSALGNWLRDNVWSQGARYDLEEIVQRICGERLAPRTLRAHLTSRYVPAEAAHGGH